LRFFRAFHETVALPDATDKRIIDMDDDTKIPDAGLIHEFG
jgi:hypothetical protein